MRTDSGNDLYFTHALIRDGAYEFVVQQDGFEETTYRVDGVIGGAHMLGGGTQGFVSRLNDIQHPEHAQKADQSRHGSFR